MLKFFLYKNLHLVRKLKKKTIVESGLETSIANTSSNHRSPNAGKTPAIVASAKPSCYFLRSVKTINFYADYEQILSASCSLALDLMVHFTRIPTNVF